MPSGGTKTCDCTKQGGVGGHIPCQCTKSRYFPNKVPDRWICDDCARNKHEWY
jgi:hypothetical protein